MYMYVCMYVHVRVYDLVHIVCTYRTFCNLNFILKRGEQVGIAEQV